MLGRFWANSGCADHFIGTLLLPLLVAPAAYAQERRSPSILEFFGIRPAKPKVVVKPVKRAKKKIISKTSEERQAAKNLRSQERGKRPLLNELTEAPINADAPVNP